MQEKSEELPRARYAWKKNNVKMQGTIHAQMPEIICDDSTKIANNCVQVDTHEKKVHMVKLDLDYPVATHMFTERDDGEHDGDESDATEGNAISASASESSDTKHGMIGGGFDWSSQHSDVYKDSDNNHSHR